jgi:hypothetical protein
MGDGVILPPVEKNGGIFKLAVAFIFFIQYNNTCENDT